MLRPSHQKQVAAILNDPEASQNDKYVALQFLRNSEIAAKGVLPTCQDTGTAIIMGKKGQRVWTGGGDEAALSQGVYNTYIEDNLRYSQNAALDMYKEVNTGTNLPAQIDLYSVDGDEYKFLCMAKGGGSANKTYLYQETKALITPAKLKKYLVEKMRTLGHRGLPALPYRLRYRRHLCGSHAENRQARLCALLRWPANRRQRARPGRSATSSSSRNCFRKRKTSASGAQFGGKYFAHDIRVIRLPRHGASCPIGMGVSCSADRNIKAKINREGIWIEKLEHNPGQYIPESLRQQGEGDVVSIDLNKPMPDILAQLSAHPVSTRLSLNGTIIVARDIAHAKLKELLDNGEELPQYVKDHPIYYAGPAKTPEGYASGSLGPTTAGRMDSYVDLLQSNGASMIMLAKGNRSQQVTDACHKHGGFYLGSIGGPAAVLAQNSIKSPRSAWRILNWEWKPSGKLKWRTSRRLSRWMTKATTSSSRSRINSAKGAHSAERFHNAGSCDSVSLINPRLSLPGFQMVTIVWLIPRLPTSVGSLLRFSTALREDGSAKIPSRSPAPAGRAASPVR